MIYLYPCLEKASSGSAASTFNGWNCWPLFQVGDDGYADLLGSLLDTKTQCMCIYSFLWGGTIADIIGRYLTSSAIQDISPIVS